MTTIYLAVGGSAKTLRRTLGHAELEKPHLLCSYAYRKHLDLMREPDVHYVDYVLDCGAFTAHSSGKPVVLEDYITFCKELIPKDDKLVEVFALDVIGDWKATLKNVEKMWKAGIPAIPCYHVSDPEHVLKTLAKTYPKIALGAMAGRAMRNARSKWVEQCFARVWPKAVHGFGISDRGLFSMVPWHSVDMTTWVQGPQAFGCWAGYGNAQLSLRGEDLEDLRVNVDYYLTVQAEVRQLWANDLAALPPLPSLRNA